MTDNHDDEPRHPRPGEPAPGPEDIAGRGEPHVTDDLEETVREATARQRRERLGRHLAGRGATETRSWIARTTTARRADEMRGLVEIEEAQAIVLEEPRPLDLTPDGEKRGARQVALWFFVAALASIAFCAVFIIVGTGPSLRSENVLLGLTMGIALLAAGCGLVTWVKKIMPHEEAVQLREELHPTEEERAAFEIDFVRGLEESGVTRRKVIVGSMGLGTGLLVVPPLFYISDLGPSPTGGKGRSLLDYTAWSKDLRFVLMDSGRYLKLGDLEVGEVAAVMPEGHESTDQQADSSLQVVRLRPEDIDMSYFEAYAKKKPIDQPGLRNHYSATDFVLQGHVAYSRICTHAGCPVTCYMRQKKAFVCPCHQSTFRADQAGHVVFGPAGHSLPMLPFYVDDKGYFRAKGDFIEPIGPSFWERG